VPATYTYNDGIEDAKRELVDEWKHAFSETEPEKHMRFVLDLIGRLERLKRPSRRKRTPRLLGAGQALPERD
jgi:hypothetical protein